MVVTNIHYISLSLSLSLNLPVYLCLCVGAFTHPFEIRQSRAFRNLIMSHKNQLPLQYSGRIPIMRNEELFEIENYKREGGREGGRERENTRN